MPEPRKRSDQRDDGGSEHRVLWDESLVAYAPNGWKSGRRGTIHLSRPRPGEVVVEVEPVRSSALVHVKPHAVDPRLVLLADPASDRAAAFRLLCDNLLEKGLPRVVAVSSAATNEGKTTCALNLALAIAERGLTRVLLVDGNFLHPDLAEIFAIDEHAPASPALSFPWLAPFKLAELTRCIHVAALVGPCDRFEVHKFGAFVDRLNGLGYDHVIIDAPALDGAAAVTQLVSAADSVLLAVRSGRTTARALRRAVDRVAPGKMLGVALMDADPKT